MTVSPDWLHFSERGYALLAAGLEPLLDRILAGAGAWIQDGWRYATGAEVCSLFLRYAFASDPCPGRGMISPTKADAEATIALIGFLGATNGMPPSIGTGGYYQGDESGLFGIADFVGLLGENPAIGEDWTAASLGEAYGTIGSFLVRTVVPEPSTLVLLALGTMIVGWASRST